MGADILTTHNPHHTLYTDHALTPNQSQYRIHFTSNSRDANLYNSHYLNKNFQFNQQSLAVISREQIVDNNFSQQFDPLFTTIRSENKNIYGKFRILCSNITNEKIQQYRISFRNQSDFRTYLVSYFWRKNHLEFKDWPLVKTTNLKLYDDSKRMLRGGISGFISKNCKATHDIYCKVYVQDVPLRLCHIKDIPFPENLYVLRQVLKGFHIIYENIGYIKPFEDLICITRKGVIKVWINSDLSKNFPNVENIDDNITSTKSESKLINEILHIVMTNTDPKDEPVEFSVYLKQQHVNMDFISFEKIFEMISRYEMQYGIEIPDTFASVVQVLNQQEEEYDTYRTDMEHGNQQRLQSSQRIRSQNRSGSGLFLDVPNTSSRHKFANPRDKTTSNIESRKQQKQKHKNKMHKTQSLRIGQNQHHSMQSSVIGVKSNIMLSQSLPISRGMNLQNSSNEINGSGLSNKDVSRSRQEESSSQIQKLNEMNFVQVERNNDGNNQDDSLVNKGSKHGSEDQKQVSKSSIPFGRAGLKNNSNVLHQQFGYIRNHQNNTAHPTHAHNQQPHPLMIKSTHPLPQTLPVYKQINQSHHQSHQHQHHGQIHSNNQIHLNDSQLASQFFKNKKTYSNLWMERKVDDHQLNNEEQEEHQGVKVDATEEELQHMIEIDRFLQAEVIKQEEQKLRLSQMYQAKNQLLKKSQQLSSINNTHLNINNSHSQQISQQKKNKKSMPLPPPTLKKHSSSQLSSKQQQFSFPQMHSSRQNQHSNDSNGQYMHSSHHLPHLDEPSYDAMVMNSHIVQRSARGVRHLSGQSQPMHHVVFNDHKGQQLSQQQSHLLSPHSKSSINPTDQHMLSFHHSNMQIEMQPPSSSRNEQSSSEYISNPINSQRTSQPSHTVISTGRNHVIVSMNQHQNLVSFSPIGPPHALVSSTSIGHSILHPINHHMPFHQQNIMITAPQQHQTNFNPKVTFAVKTPQHLSYTNVQSSHNVSINQLAFSQSSGFPQYYNHNHGQQIANMPLSASSTGQQVSIPNINRLGYRANTMVSAYVPSQGGQSSSRKYCDHEQSSSYSKPSIVEYSFLRNPEYFASMNQSMNQNAQNFEKQNLLIAERSMENSIQRIPILETQSIKIDQNTNQQNFPRTQINHQYSYHSNHYQPQLLDITPIPEEIQAQMFNNSRSLANNDDYMGYASYQNSQQRNQQQIQVKDVEFLEYQTPTHQHHQRQSSGIKVVESQRQERQGQSYAQQSQVIYSNDNSYARQGKFLRSQEFSRFIEQPVKSQSSNSKVHHPQVKINIRPSFQSMSGCSQHQNQPFSNKSYQAYSKEQNRSSFYSGQQKPPQETIVVPQRASDQGSNQNGQPVSNYRFVQSIEENRPNSAYQMDIDALDKECDFVMNLEQSSGKHQVHYPQDKKLLNPNFSSIHNPVIQQTFHKNICDKASHSPTQSQNPSPRMHRLPQKPVTGRTMFMNNENQLLSQFIDPESQMQSQVDYTYNSYDKWKDKSRVGNFGPSRFREFDQRPEQEGDTSNRKFNNIAFNYHERHGNHKQLVKSSIEGTKLLNHHFSKRENFNTDKKEQQKQINDNYFNEQNSNQVYFQAFLPERRMELTGYKMALQYHEEQIDEDILHDLREV